MSRSVRPIAEKPAAMRAVSSRGKTAKAIALRKTIGRSRITGYLAPAAGERRGCGTGVVAVLLEIRGLARGGG